LQRYTEIAPHIQLSGPTSFAPIIYEAIRIVKEAKAVSTELPYFCLEFELNFLSNFVQYHILVIIADGQITNEAETTRAIVEASQYPLSIIVIGVGYAKRPLHSSYSLTLVRILISDGPWEQMEEYDDGLPQRKFGTQS